MNGSIVGLLACMLALQPPVIPNVPDKTPDKIETEEQAVVKPLAKDVTYAPTAHFAAGQQFRFRTEGSLGMTFEGKNGPGETFPNAMDMRHAYTLRTLLPADSALFRMHYEGGSLVDAAGSMNTLPPDEQSADRELTFTKLARLNALKESSETNLLNSLSSSLLNQPRLLIPIHFVPLPDHAVHGGEIWELDSPDTGSPATKTPDKNNKAKNETGPIQVHVKASVIGTEDWGTIETMVVREEVTCNFTVGVDSKGKPTTDAHPSGRVKVQLVIRTQANLLPTDGQVIRSEGELNGLIEFEGSLLKQSPASKISLQGKLKVLRLPDRRKRIVPVEPSGDPQDKKAAPMPNIRP